MRTYQFCYSLSDRHTLVPLYLTVHAPNLRRATKAAQCKLRDIVRAERAAYWQWEKEGLDGEWRAVYVPYHHLRGYLYEGSEVRPRLSPRQMTEAIQRMASPEAVEALASVLSAPILQVIEDAPVWKDLFNTWLPEPVTDFSIPLFVTSAMERELWPTARHSRHRA